MLTSLVGAALALATPAGADAPAAGESLVIESSQVDAKAAASGLRARVGADLAGWTIEVHDLDAGVVRASFRHHDGRTIEREIEVPASSTEERSRELAAGLAVILDEAETAAPAQPAAPEADPEPTATPPSEAPPALPVPADRPRPWFGAGFHIGLGPPRALDIDPGVDLLGGVGLLRDHLHPIAAITWSVQRRADLVAHALRAGVGVAAGSPLGRRLWLGAGVLPQVLWLTFHDPGVRYSLWNGAGQAFALARARVFARPKGPALLVAARSGVDVTLPWLRLHGDTATLERTHARWFIALDMGVSW